ncbi:MAG: hypothetical protein A2236_00070 [Bacteroidetes bacterium RIFOXYA2_FULL_33_7]|nr:MAG: hypothetical protein A2236_00070 [Bacteroidetes bacterium RIFOXYA2_FULL_33_7]
MRKFTLLILLATFTFFAVGQNRSTVVKTQKLLDKKEFKGQTIHNLQSSTRAVGDVIWENDFSHPSDWTISNNTGDDQDWVITNIDDPDAGYGRGTWDDVDNVITNENNYGMFDSDAVGSDGGTQDAYLAYNGTINLIDYPNVAIKFAQRVALFTTTECIVQISADNGVTWTDFDVNAGRATSTTYEDFVNLNISSVAGNQPLVKIRFNYIGSWDYLWCVDDVQLVVASANELVLENAWADFYGLGYYSNTPKNQVTNLTMFYGAVFNNGTYEQTNIKLNVEVDDNNAIVHSIDGTIYASSMPGARDTIDADSSTTTTDSFFLTPAEIASYNVNYTLTQAETDENIGNNTFEIKFNVTDTIFARDIEYNTYTGPSRYDDGVDGDRVGVAYYFPVDDEVSSISVYIPTLTDVETSFIGKILMDDGAGNLIEAVTTDIHVVAEADLGGWVTVPFIKDGASEFITAGTDGKIVYAMIECYFEGIGDFYVGADNTPYLPFEDGTMLQLGSSNYWISIMPMVRLNVVSTSACTAVITSKIDASCFGESDGQAVVSTAGCNDPYTFLWSNGATNDTITGLAAGTYTVTVTDASSATSTATVTISQPQVLAITAVVTDEGGYQASDGSVDLTITGGTAPFTYVWDNGKLTQDLDNLGGGTFSVTVTDLNGCTATGTYEVAASVCAMTSEISGTNVSCFAGNDGTVNFTVANGTAPYTFEWLSGETTEDLTGLEAGYYSVTATDAEGCISYENITLGQPTAITSSSVATNALCNGGSDGSIDLSVSGGTAPYTYEWNHGALAQDVLSLSAGDYVVTITDANACELLDTVSVSAPNALVTTLTNIVTLNYCNGGKAIADMSYTGGTVPYTYHWSTGSTAADLAIMTAPAEGTYMITATDSHGCIALDTVVIDMPDIMSVTGVVTPTTGTDGAIDITAVGGTTPFTYTWSNAATTEDLTGLAEGLYTVTVKDSHNCTANYVGAVNDVSCDLTVTLTPSTLLCNGDADGNITLDTTGSSVSIASYLWSNGATTKNIFSIEAGTYTVTVTDDSSCVVIATAVITEPEELILDMVGTDISCNGLTDGAIDITVSGGTMIYTYLWDNAATTADITGLSAGTYTVIVTDASNCTVEDSVTIAEPSVIVASIVGTDISCNGNFDGSADLSVSGGTAPYTYDWNNNAMTQDISDLLLGTYTVTISDANACEETATVVIAEPAVLVASIVGTDVLCFGDSTGLANLSVSGGTTPYDFTWSNAESTEDISDLAAGTYTVAVLDLNSCSANASVVIAESSELLASVVGSDITCNGLTDGEANLTVTGGVSPYTFAWDNSATTEDLTELPAGTYNVVVTDSNACTTSATVVILDPTALSASATGTNVLCNGAATGDADLTVSGGTAPYTYAWDNSVTTQDLSNVVAGTYNVIVSDANACTANASVSITEPTAIVATTIVTGPWTSTSTDGTIDLTVSGGVSPYTFAWSNDSTSEDISISVAANYTVTVTDANGCTEDASAVALGVNTIATTSVNIYPNPSKGILNVTNVKGSEVSVYNIIGEAIIKLTSTTNNVSLDMSELSNGTYIVRIVKDSNVITKKVMLKK